jgi:hypothetical protein
MKKIVLILAAVYAAAGLVFAGLDMYTGKTYTTLMAPTLVGSYMTGPTTTAVVVTYPAVTSAAPSGVDCVGLPGRGALVMSLNPGSVAGGVVSMSFLTCATTNGTYITVTNADGNAAWAATTTAAYVVAPIVPNSKSRYWRVVVTATGATNATAGAVLVTE